MKKIKISLIALIFILIITTIFIVITKNRENTNNENVIGNYEVEENYIQERSIEKVDNPIMYFTVRSCIEKYINYLADNKLDMVYKLLDYEYKEKLFVTEQNVQNFVETVYETSNLRIQEMYVQKIDEDNEKYYVKGTLIEITGGEDSEFGDQKEFIVTVKIDHKNMIFSIIPFGDGGVFYGE